MNDLIQEACQKTGNDPNRILSVTVAGNTIMEHIFLGISPIYIPVGLKFNIGELDNEDRLPAFRAIEDNNYSLFLELTPQPIHNLFEKIFSEYRYWSGQLLKPIND